MTTRELRKLLSDRRCYGVLVRVETSGTDVWLNITKTVFKRAIAGVTADIEARTADSNDGSGFHIYVY